jgi:hypothetical protein
VTGLPLFRVLALATPTSAPGFVIESCAGWAEAVERLAGDDPFDAVMVDGDNVACPADEGGAIAERAALVIVGVEPDAEHAPGWLRRGADDVIGRDELAAASGWRRVRFAIDRRRRALDYRSASPRSRHRPAASPQLLEHLSQPPRCASASRRRWRCLPSAERVGVAQAGEGARGARSFAPARRGSRQRRCRRNRRRHLRACSPRSSCPRTASRGCRSKRWSRRFASAVLSPVAWQWHRPLSVDGKDAGRPLRRAWRHGAAAPATSRRPKMLTVDVASPASAMPSGRAAQGSFPLADLAQILGPSCQRRVGEIGEHAVHSERVVLEVLPLGVAVVVGRQPSVLVAKREGVDK